MALTPAKRYWLGPEDQTLIAGIKAVTPVFLAGVTVSFLLCIDHLNRNSERIPRSLLRGERAN